MTNKKIIDFLTAAVEDARKDYKELSTKFMTLGKKYNMEAVQEEVDLWYNKSMDAKLETLKLLKQEIQQYKDLKNIYKTREDKDKTKMYGQLVDAKEKEILFLFDNWDISDDYKSDFISVEGSK